MKSLIALLLSLFFFAVNAQEKPFPLLQYHPDGIEIHWNDYFLDTTSLDIIRTPKGLHKKEIAPLVDVFTGEMKKMLDYFTITVDGKSYDLAIRNHNRVPFHFSFKSDKIYNDLKIKGNFNGWNTNANPLQYKNGVYSFDTYLNPGRYEYCFVEEGTEFPDPSNPKKVGNGIGGINSIFEVSGDEKKPLFIYAEDTKNNTINVISQEGDYSHLHYFIFWNNQLKETIVGIEGIQMAINNYFQTGLNFLRIYAMDEKSVSNEILIPFLDGNPIMNASHLPRTDPHTYTMYSILLDRFKNGDIANDRPLNRPDVLPANDWKGGDMRGLIQVMDEGYFENLGINTLWILPIIKNPEGPYGHMKEFGIETKFSGYHGYWPISFKEIDARMGSAEQFRTIIDKAHTKNMNVLLDYVANHVHEEHPILKEQPDWKTMYDLPDGRKNIRLFDEQRLTTWFDHFMPSLDLENPKAIEILTDSAVWWFKEYPIDGFRHDATKHIPNAFWRALTGKLKREINRPFYQIGETYGGADLIASYLNPGLLDAQFDFNLYHHISHGLLEEDYSLKNLKTALHESLYYYGDHHVMGNITGNHDKARIISYADGSLSFNENAKEAGYTRTIKNKGKAGYQKIAQLMALNFSIPGIPIIYYGDEIGMPGGDDPDNRRMMQFQDLTKHQQWLKETTTKLAKLRTSRMDLTYGSTQILKVEDDLWVMIRSYFSHHSILIINKKNKNRKITFQLPEQLKNSYTGDYISQFNKKYEVKEGQITIKLCKNDFDIITYN